MFYKKLAPVVLFLLGAALMCLVFEAVLQFTDPTDYDRFETDLVSGLVHNKPNSSFLAYNTCFSNKAAINSLGFHAPEPPKNPKQPGEFRIIVTGSSFVEGTSSSVEQLLSSALEQKLNALPNKRYSYVVTPVAFSGNGTYFNILYYLRYGKPLQPDLVIDVSTEYELGRDVPDVPHPPQFDTKGRLLTGPLPIASDSSLSAKIKKVTRKSKLVMNLYNRYLVLRQNKTETSTGVAETQPTRTQLAAQWTLEEKLLSAFNEEAIAGGAQFMVASWATGAATAEIKEALRSNLSRIAASHDFSYLDMSPSISAQEKESGKSASWPCDEHWSPTGNAFVAQTLFDYLQANPSLLRK